jgi:hypothetical protein
VSPQQLAVAGPGSSTPPLTDDSSPSPPSSVVDPPQGRHSRRVSLAVPPDGSERDAGDDRLKRKASGADLDAGARKAAHSGMAADHYRLLFAPLISALRPCR